MATLQSLAKRMRKLAKAESQLGNDVAKALAQLLVVRLTEVTPVDTSKAVSNWQVTLNTASASEIEAIFPGSKRSTMSQSVNEARNKAILVLKKKKIGQTIYISNTADYIRDLNDGTSKQAPAGFIEEAIYSCRNEIPRILRTIRDVRRTD